MNEGSERIQFDGVGQFCLHLQAMLLAGVGIKKGLHVHIITDFDEW